jgi:hypothetical protein
VPLLKPTQLYQIAAADAAKPKIPESQRDAYLPVGRPALLSRTAQ